MKFLLSLLLQITKLYKLFELLYFYNQLIYITYSFIFISLNLFFLFNQVINRKNLRLSISFCNFNWKIKLIDRKPKTVYEFEDISDQLSKMLYQRKIQDETLAYLEELNSSAQVQRISQ